jgi:hypothetical protein
MMNREQLMRMQASSRIVQQRYDDAFSNWNMRAAQMMVGQDLEDYHRRLAVQAKRLLPNDHKLRALQYRAMPADAFAAIEPDLLRAVSEYGCSNDSAPEGGTREVQEIGRNGERVTKFLGNRSFIHDLKAIPRRVVSWNSIGGRVRANGTYF